MHFIHLAHYIAEGGLKDFAVGVAQTVEFYNGAPVFSEQDFTPCLQYQGFALPDQQVR